MISYIITLLFKQLPDWFINYKYHKQEVYIKKFDRFRVDISLNEYWKDGVR
jgi:hypothetical protein